MTILKSKIHKMSSETVATVGLRLIETIEKSGTEEVKNSIYFSQLKEVNNRYRKAIEPVDKATKMAISGFFDLRREVFANMYDMVRGLTSSRIASDKAAAVRLFSVLNMYGVKSFINIRKADLTQRYKTIVEALKQPKFAADIEQLKLSDMLTELEVAHSTYESMYRAWGDAQSLRIPSAQMRQEMNTALKNIIDEVSFLSGKYPTEANIVLSKNIEQRFAEVYVTAPGAVQKAGSDQTEKSGQTATDSSDVA